jgi:hypothetical protein
MGHGHHLDAKTGVLDETLMDSRAEGIMLGKYMYIDGGEI